MTKQNVAVVGAGILGLCVARSLALEGSNVTIFERNYIGSGTSNKTFAWVNSNGKKPDSYHYLNDKAIEEHIKLQQYSHTAGKWLIQTGTYEWASYTADKDRLHKRIKRLIALNYPVEEISYVELKNKIPEILPIPDNSKIWFFPKECLLIPSIFIAWLISELRRLNVAIHTQSDVIDLKENTDRVEVRLANGMSWIGDQLVLATGRWATELVSKLGHQLAMIDPNQPNKIACGFLAYTHPVYTQLNSNLITPDLNIRPEGGGRLLLQATDLDHFANPANLPSINGFIAEEILQRLKRILDNMNSANLEHIAVGQRSRPSDGLPALGYISPLNRIYLMVTHSGMTLAPLIGRICSEEILNGQRSPLLNDFNPFRLLDKSTKDFPSFETLHYPAAQ